MSRRQIISALTVMALTALLYSATLLHAPDAVPVTAESVTQTVTLSAMEGFAAVMARCETAQAARIEAARLTHRGSAGFILRDNGYLVLGTMLKTQEEADVMQERLAEQGLTVECRACGTDALTLRVTAQQRQIDALTAALHAADMAAVQPEQIAQQLERGQIDGARARGLAAMLVSDLETAQADLTDSGAQGSLCDSLNGLLMGALQALESLTEDRGQTALSLAGELRCAGMSVWFARADMAEYIRNMG